MVWIGLICLTIEISSGPLCYVTHELSFVHCTRSFIACMQYSFVTDFPLVRPCCVLYDDAFLKATEIEMSCSKGSV
jgi:hypothetical protein